MLTSHVERHGVGEMSSRYGKDGDDARRCFKAIEHDVYFFVGTKVGRVGKEVGTHKKAAVHGLRKEPKTTAATTYGHARDAKP